MTTPTFFDTLYLMILENHGWSQVQDCQFVKFFDKNGITFTNWCGVLHPSGPNYRAVLSGNTWSSNEFDGVPRPNVARHLDYEVYAYRGSPAERHNPFLDMNPSDPRAKEFRQAPIKDSSKDIVYIGLDDNNNAHNDDNKNNLLRVADENVMHAVTEFNSIASDRRKFFIILFDEAYGKEHSINHVFAGAIGFGVDVKKVHSRITHYSLAQFLCDNWELTIDELDPQGRTYSGSSILELA